MSEIRKSSRKQNLLEVVWAASAEMYKVRLNKKGLHTVQSTRAASLYFLVTRHFSDIS